MRRLLIALGALLLVTAAPAHAQTPTETPTTAVEGGEGSGAESQTGELQTTEDTSPSTTMVRTTSTTVPDEAPGTEHDDEGDDSDQQQAVVVSEPHDTVWYWGPLLLAIGSGVALLGFAALPRETWPTAR